VRMMFILFAEDLAGWLTRQNPAIRRAWPGRWQMRRESRSRSSR
jgi:hypothetical protein